jgi:hypothetical protein
MTSRRGVLKLIGGGVVLAAASAGAFVALNQPSRAAREAWRTAGQETEFRRRFLSYALLAPNPHNRQPWLVQLEGDDALTLYVDLERRLPATDPVDRQIILGCGAFLELLRLAAAEEAYGAEITMFPDGAPDMTGRLDARPVARVRFTPATPTAKFTRRAMSSLTSSPPSPPPARLSASRATPSETIRQRSNCAASPGAATNGNRPPPTRCRKA